MIKIEDYAVPSGYQWRMIVDGVRNPKNSWAKSDSGLNVYADDFNNEFDAHIDIGPKDLELMMKLNKAGSSHSKYRRMLPVCVTITAPLYWWKEFDTYKVGTVSNSCSTMHKIHEKEFTLENFSCEHLLSDGSYDNSGYIIDMTIEALNYWRNLYLIVDEYLKNRNNIASETRQKLVTLQKKYWWRMIQLLPSSYNQKRTIMLNYEVLANIYRDRKDHKLDEWRDFCKWIIDLPYSELITGFEVQKDE